MVDINPEQPSTRNIVKHSRAVRPVRQQVLAGGGGARRVSEAFVKALTEAGWLAALITGAVRRGRSDGHRGVGHPRGDQSIWRELRRLPRADVHHGRTAAAWLEDQKQKYLPAIASGELRLQSFAVTEPTTGTDTTKTRTTAVRHGDRYIVNGQKVWISRIQHSDLMLLLARTTPVPEVKKKTEGMSIFLVDLRGAEKKGMTVRPIRNMVNHETNEVFFEDFEVPAENLIGQEGLGFRYILDGMNAERILIAAECIGDGFWFIDKARTYANERIVFDRPIGRNQGVQFPIARAYANVRAADLMRFEAARLFDAGKPAGAEANLAKLLAADASWEAANACLQTFGGFGFAADYDVERKFRETRLYQIAPISTNLILSYIGEHVLGMPRSF
jgi:acyl-CoA dehydrogenase